MPKPKCHHCKIKLSLMKFRCKCENIFCLKCLLPETHNCTFNYKLEGKHLIEKKNPAVINSKVPSI